MELRVQCLLFTPECTHEGGEQIHLAQHGTPGTSMADTQLIRE